LLAYNYRVPATPGIETGIAHFNTHYCVYIGIRHNAPACGKHLKAGALYNCSPLWSYQDLLISAASYHLFFISQSIDEKIFSLVIDIE